MTKRTTPFLTALLTLLLFASTVTAGEGRLNEGAIHQKALALLQAKKYVESVQAYRPLLKAKPLDPIANYNVACARALLGRTEWALTFLEKSVEGGYIDFDHMLEDSDLESIREEARFLRLYDDREKYVREAEAKRENEYRRRLGKSYVFIKDDEYRFLLVTNIGEKDRLRFRNMLRNYATALWKDFFRFKPRFLVTVLVPRDWLDYLNKFGGRFGTAGFYSHGTRTLTVNRATGD
ncbi:MAG: TPR end-of-group domain-containing protein, partial [Planctomycetota bacterium]